MSKHSPGEGEEPDILEMPAKDGKEHEEEERVGEGAAHIGAAEYYQAQGLIDDVGQHGAQCQKGQAHAAKAAGCCQSNAYMGKEKHWAENLSIGI